MLINAFLHSVVYSVIYTQESMFLSFVDEFRREHPILL